VPATAGMIAPPVVVLRSEPDAMLVIAKDVDVADASEVRPETVKLPEKIEVAVVDVAVKKPASALVPRSELPLTESVRYGVVVPTPKNPAAVKVDVAVPPKNAWVAENFVVEALPLKLTSVVVELLKPANG
jgi:hypothetical protein